MSDDKRRMSFSKLFKPRKVILQNVNCILANSVRSLAKKKGSDDDYSITKKTSVTIEKDINKLVIPVKKVFAEESTEQESVEKLSVLISSDSAEKVECDKNQDDKVVIVTEREKDANVRGRLSKEYDRFMKKKISLASTGLNLSVEIDKEKPSYDIIPPESFPKIRREIEKTPFVPEFDIKIQPEPPLEKPVRQEPGKVIMCVIPEEWLYFFLSKTGVTGFYTFVFTFGTFLISKELYVLEHNFYNGLSMLVMCWGGVKWIGPHFKKYADREIDFYEEAWVKSREAEKTDAIEAIDHEGWLQYQMEGNVLLMDAKRENITLQLEDEYRKRQMHVYEEVKKLLDYQVEVAQVYKRIQHKNLLDYVLHEVSKSVTPDMHDKLIYFSIDRLVAELEREDKKK